MLAYARGDAAAFETLYARHSGGSYRYFLRSLRNPGVAQELLQDLWMSVIRARDTFEAQACFATWLYRMAHNRLIDHYRRSNVVELVALEEEDGDGAPAQVADGAPGPEAAAAAAARQSAGRLLQLVEALPAAQREAFLLQEEGGLSLAEIAAATGTGIETVKSRLRYAMNRLREGMGIHMNDTRDPDISRLYRDASVEAPPAALGQSLRAVAAAALAQPAAQSPTPGVIAGPARRAQRKRGAPLALAASVVLGLGVVLRVAVERPDMGPAVAEPAAAPAAAPVVPPPSPSISAMGEAPAQPRQQPESEKREAPSADKFMKGGDWIVAQRKSVPPKAAAEPAGQPGAGGVASVLADVAPKPAEPAKRVAPETMSSSVSGPEPARATAPPAAPAVAPPAPKGVRMQRDADTAAQRTSPEGRAAPADRKMAVVPAQGARARVDSASAESGAAQAEQRIIAEERGLTEAEWIRRIIDLRRAGRTVDADASLRRFMLRHPDYNVPGAARAP